MSAHQPHQPDDDVTGEEERDWYEPAARPLSGTRIRRYSRFVSGMKLALPLLAAGVVLVLMIWPSTQPSSAPPRKATSVDSTMQSPIYNSRDDKGQPYEVKADTAKQNADAPTLTDLANPRGEIQLEGGSTIKGDAKGAQYDQNKGMLNINGNLVLHHSSGAVFETQKAQVDMNAKSASGDAPVKVTGDFGEVNASDGFELQDQGKVVIFKGPSTAHLKLGSGQNPADAVKDLVPASPSHAAPPAPSNL